MKFKCLSFLFILLIISFIICSCEDKTPNGFIDCSGRIEGDEAKVGTKISGKVIELLVKEGDIVKKGQTIAKLSSEQIMAGVKQAQAQVDVAKKQLDEAKNNADIQKAQVIQARDNVDMSVSKLQESIEGVNIASTKVNEAASNVNLSTYQAKESTSGVDVSKSQFEEAKHNTVISEKDINKANVSILQTKEQSNAQIKEAEAGVEASKAMLSQAQANFDLQEKDFERYSNLYKEDAIAKSDYDKSEAAYKSAKEQVKASEKQLEQAKANLNLARTTDYNITLSEKQLEIAQASNKATKASEKSAFIMIDSSKAKESSAYAMIDVSSAQYQTSLAYLGQARAQAKEAEISVQIANTNLKATELAYKASLAKVNQAQANLASAEAALQSAKADLDDTNIYAPYDGVVLTKVTEEGEVLSPGSVLFTMVDTNKLYMKAYIPNEQVGKLKIGSSSRIYLDAYNKYFEGTVTEINQQAEFTPKNVETKEQRVKLVFGVKVYLKENPTGEVKTGMPGYVRIKWEDSANW